MEINKNNRNIMNDTFDEISQKLKLSKNSNFGNLETVKKSLKNNFFKDFKMNLEIFN